MRLPVRQTLLLAQRTQLLALPMQPLVRWVRRLLLLLLLLPLTK